MRGDEKEWEWERGMRKNGRVGMGRRAREIRMVLEVRNREKSIARLVCVY